MSEKSITVDMQDVVANSNFLINYELVTFSDLSANFAQNLKDLDVDKISQNTSFKLITSKQNTDSNKFDPLNQLDVLHAIKTTSIKTLEIKNQNNFTYQPSRNSENLSFTNWLNVLKNNNLDTRIEFTNNFSDTDVNKVINTQQKENNIQLQNASERISKYQNFMKSYIGNEGTILSDAAIKILGVTNEARRNIEDILAEERPWNYSTYYKNLRGSILDYDYLTNIQKDLVKEPVNLTGMTFIRAKDVNNQGGYGPTFLPFKVLETNDIQRINFEESFNLRKSPKPTNVVFDVNEHRNYSKLSQGIRTSLIHEITTNLDAQLQYYLAYFTKVSDGVETLMNIYIKTTNSENVLTDVVDDKNLNAEFDNKYYYYFYTDSFDFKPVKKTESNLQYGAYKTSTALNYPSGKNEFSFSIPADLELTFYYFITRNGLGLNTSLGVPSNSKLTVAKDVVNLNFVFNQQQSNPDLENFKIDRFVLRDVKFSDIKDLSFNYKGDQSKLNVRGIYNKLSWYHNENLREL